MYSTVYLYERFYTVNVVEIPQVLTYTLCVCIILFIGNLVNVSLKSSALLLELGENLKTGKKLFSA